MKLFRQATLMAMTAVLPRKRWLVRGSRRASNEPPALSLTFDDGPDPVHTPAVLAALAKWNLTATFFIVGQKAEQHPQLMQQIVDAGHNLGNHTYSHTEPRETPAEQFLSEVDQTDRILTTWSDRPSPWVRPPKGELTWPKFRGLWQSGRRIALWSADPRDYRMKADAEAVAWAKAYRPRHGDILLMHDRFPFAAKIVQALGEAWVFYNWQTVSLDHWTAGGRASKKKAVA